MGQLFKWAGENELHCVCEIHSGEKVLEFFEPGENCPSCSGTDLEEHPSYPSWVTCSLCGFAAKNAICVEWVEHELGSEIGEDENEF